MGMTLQPDDVPTIFHPKLQGQSGVALREKSDTGSRRRAPHGDVKAGEESTGTCGPNERLEWAGEGQHVDR